MTLAAAVAAVQRGWHVFPCNPAGARCPQTGDVIDKQPHLLWPGKPYKVKWGEVATQDLNQVCRWWGASPNANVGIACRPSGLLVVDCDMPKRAYQLKDTPWEFLHDKLGPLVDGSDVLREMCGRFGDDYARFERTYRVCTASMGLHLYFAWPKDVEASQASPVPGLLDVRGNGGTKGGYVLGAGSTTVKGPYVPENNLPVADAPPWLIELVREKPKPARVKPLFSQPRSGNFSGLVEAVTYAAEGNRSNLLYWSARSMCEDGATEEEAIKLLVPAAEACGLPERDATSTVRSGYKSQQRKTS